MAIDRARAREIAEVGEEVRRRIQPADLTHELREHRLGGRMNVRGPAKRGIANASGGPYRGMARRF